MDRRILCFFVLFTITKCNADTMDIYNTRLATSDLQWDKHSNSPDEGWEEVSSFDKDYRNTIRSYQVCEDSEGTNNWIRSPYIPSRGGKMIYLDVEFSITRCQTNPDGRKSNNCKETFNIFYYEADSNVASSTFPPWQETPYVKVDTVAANDANFINKKTFNFGPLNRSGIYIAMQDQGACMSLITLRVYYYYCPETTEQLVNFPQTVSDAGVASLVEVSGHCTAHAILASEEEPRYRCSSKGEWLVPTGACHCKAGYQANKIGTDCFPCSEGTYKLVDGSGSCARCPSNSGIPVASTTTSEIERVPMTPNQCPCYPGYARAPGESIADQCTKPPSAPTSLHVADSTTTSMLLEWMSPDKDGGRDDLFYRIKCETASISDSPDWIFCSDDISPSLDGERFYETSVRFEKLPPYKKYRFTVTAMNGASLGLGEEVVGLSSAEIDYQTEEAVPSSVRKVHETYRTKSSISLGWDAPEHPNGVIRNYEVELRPVYEASPRPRVDLATPITKEVQENSIKFENLEENRDYKVRVRARTSAGYGQFTEPYSVKTISPYTEPQNTSEQPDSTIFIVLAICGLLVIVVILGIVYRYKKTGQFLCLNTSRAESKTELPVNNGSPGHDPYSHEPLIVDLPPLGHRIYVDYPDPRAAIAKMKREVNPKNIKIEEVIGTGEFAEVCRGKLLKNKCFMDVAVKRLKTGATKKDQSNFLREASTIAQFNDPNIVQLKGVVTKSTPVMIVTEYMEHRSLDGFLKDNRGALSIVQLVNMLKGIASGMRYLSSMKYVHRDLAARNILVSSDLVCKVSDFGLSRTLENDPHATYTTQGGKIAIRWTALESILFRKFTSASDVWSYGIVMWEVMSHGEKPYWDMSNEDVINNVQKGMRLPAPSKCPKALHDIMVTCWLAEPNARPTFIELVHSLDAFLRQLEQPPADSSASGSTMPFPDSANELSSSNLGRAVESGEVTTVEKWLEIQRLGKYSQQFRERGIDNLDKVCNLTINDLRALGIDVTLHGNKLEDGIRTLRRHLSTATSTPSASARNSDASTLQDSDQGLTMSASRHVKRNVDV